MLALVGCGPSDVVVNVHADPAGVTVEAAVCMAAESTMDCLGNGQVVVLAGGATDGQGRVSGVPAGVTSFPMRIQQYDASGALPNLCRAVVVSPTVTLAVSAGASLSIACDPTAGCAQIKDCPP